MRIRIPAAITLLIIFVVLVSACGDSGQQTTTQSLGETGPPGIPDPCTLFIQSDAESALGGPVQAPNRSLDATSKSCSYLTKSKPEQIASINITTPCSMIDFENFADDPDAQPVEGIGMHASWDKSSLVVHASSGDTCLNINPGSGPPGTATADDQVALEKAKTIAQKVLDGLQSGGSDSSEMSM